MFKTLTAAALSAAIAFGSLGATATPAKANDDLGKFIVGAIALGIIANSINQANSRTPATQAATPTHRPPVITPTRPRPGGHGVRPHRVHIPASCEREVQINGRVTTAYGAPCLRQAGVPLDRLSTCARSGSIHGRNLTYYTKRCLRRSGFNV